MPLVLKTLKTFFLGNIGGAKASAVQFVPGVIMKLSG